MVKDEELVVRIKNGDLEAFENLAIRYQNGLSYEEIGKNLSCQSLQLRLGYVELRKF